MPIFKLDSGETIAGRAPARSTRRALLLSAGAAALLGTACSVNKPLRIGFLGSTSGRMTDLGIGARNGMQLAVDELTAAGGLAGRPLEVLIRDDEQNGDLARQRLTELFDAGVEFVIGPVTSTMAAAVLPLVVQRGIPLISPLAGANEFSGRVDPFFRVVSDTASSARQQAAALLGRGLKRVVTLGDAKNPVFTRNWTGAVAERFGASGSSVVQALEFEAAPGLRFVEVAQRVVAARAECVVIAASAADSAVLVQQIRLLQPNLMIALSAWAGTEELPALGGRALEGVLVTQFFDRFNATPRWLDFVARYQQRFGSGPGYPAMNGYDALQMGAAAVRAAGSGGLLAALRQIRALDGLQRRLTFDEFGDCLAPTYLTEVRDGKYVAVTA